LPMSMSNPKSNLGFIKFLVLAHPLRSGIASACLALAGFSEGIGLATLLPLLGIMVGKSQDQGGILGEWVHAAFQYVGVQPSLILLLVLMVALMSLKAVLVFAAMAQAGKTVAQVETQLRLSLIRALMNAGWEHFISKRQGTFSHALTVEAERSGIGYWYACRVAAYSLQVAVYGLVSALVSWQITLTAAIGGVISVALLGRFVGMARRAGLRQNELLKAVSARLLEGLASIKALKAMGCENRLTPILEAETVDLNKARKDQILIQEGRNALHEPMLVILVAGGLYSAIEIWHAELGAVMMLALLFWRTLSRVGGIQADWLELARVQGAFWSLKSAIDEAQAASETVANGQSPSLEEGVALRHVTFRYGDKTVLENVSLAIPAGSFVALVGPSGAGKTSIADLIVGLVRPVSGDVYADGVPLSAISLQEWRNLIGYTPQEAVLFHDQLYVNVSLGDPAITRAQAEEALFAAGAGDVLSGLPEGMETVVGERGAKLSGGQRQRVAIARALVRRPKLLILDEVTAALDARTEAEICENLRALKGKATILAISHQPALVSAADFVYRLENHKVRRVSRSSAEKANRLF
jgi:ATP-binding cassette, subfamily C, bacterial